MECSWRTSIPPGHTHRGGIGLQAFFFLCSLSAMRLAAPQQCIPSMLCCPNINPKAMSLSGYGQTPPKLWARKTCVCISWSSQILYCSHEKRTQAISGTSEGWPGWWKDVLRQINGKFIFKVKDEHDRASNSQPSSCYSLEVVKKKHTYI